MAVIGIDLGTTNSLAVAYIDDKYMFIPNKFNEYLTPSVVSIDDDGSVIVGKLARERLVTHTHQTTSLFKRNMGTKKKVMLGNREFLPEELSALVVKQLIEDAERFLNDSVDEVVISVPAYFDEKQRNATKRIGDILNIKVERLINEPSAAALACHKLGTDESFIVFDFGGGTLDVTVVDCFDNVTSICSIAGDNNLGGSDFDKIIAIDFCDKNNIKFNDLSDKQKQALVMQCEKLKIRLQEEDDIENKIFLDGVGYPYFISKQILNNLSQGIFTRIRNVILKAVNGSGIEKDELSKMILVGGSCHMTNVIQYLQNNISIPVVQTDDIDTTVATGLGIYIGIKQRSLMVRDLVLTDICPFSLSTAVINPNNPEKPLSNVIIPKNTVLPTSRTRSYYTSTLGQDNVSVEVYQGEAVYAQDNKSIGSTGIKVPVNFNEHEGLEVTFSYDINSLLCVEVLIKSTGEKHTFYVGEDNELKETNDTYVDYIKNASLNLSQEPEIDLLREKASRLSMLCDANTQERLKALMLDFDMLLQKYQNNLRKKANIINQVEDILQSIETNMETNSIFINDSIDNDGGWFS